MITIRKSKDRGSANHGWLESYHSFSFADYYDPQWMSFRSLRVINEDWIAPSMGFGSHPHRDMEIITYVVSGQLKHKDSMGNEGIIKAGEIQKMSAGSGVVHSEFNASSKETVHLLQIWIVPHTKSIKPVYEQHLLPVNQHNSLYLFPVTIHQDALIYRGRLTRGSEIVHSLKHGRGVWIQMISGSISANTAVASAGDAVIVETEKEVKLVSQDECEFLLFDVQ